MGVPTLERDILAIENQISDPFALEDSLQVDLHSDSKKMTIQRLKGGLISLNGQHI